MMLKRRVGTWRFRKRWAIMYLFKFRESSNNKGEILCNKIIDDFKRTLASDIAYQM